MIRYLFLLLTFCSIITQGFAQGKDFAPDRSISAAALREDFRILHSAIGIGHPAWGQYHPIDSMEKWFRATEAKIDTSMTERSFINFLYPLISKMGCGHTRLIHSKDFLKYQKKKDSDGLKRKYLPFKGIWIDEKMFVLHSPSSDSLLLPPGSEILAIEGQSISDIYQQLFQRITSDGYNQTHQRRILNRNFDGYYRFYFQEKDQYEIQFVKEQGDTSTLKIRANYATLKERLALNAKKKQEQLKKGEKIYSRKGYHLRLMEGVPHTAIMDIRGFKQRKGKKFYKKSFKYLEKAQIQNLVLDLRDNGGGAVKDASRLIAYLANEEHELIAFKRWKKHPYEKYFRQKYIYKIIAPVLLPFYFKTKKEGELVELTSKLKPKKKHHFDGKVYVLNNGQTFSASVLVGAYLQAEKRAQFIGQETGGALTGTNAFLMPKFELPNSKIRLNFPLYEIQHQVDTQEVGRGLFPDHPVIYTLEDFLKEKDLEIERVKTLIHH